MSSLLMWLDGSVIGTHHFQTRLSSLGTLAVEARLARTVDFDSIIELFASRKARKAVFSLFSSVLFISNTLFNASFSGLCIRCDIVLT